MLLFSEWKIISQYRFRSQIVSSGQRFCRYLPNTPIWAISSLPNCTLQSNSNIKLLWITMSLSSHCQWIFAYFTLKKRPPLSDSPLTIFRLTYSENDNADPLLYNHSFWASLNLKIASKMTYLNVRLPSPWILKVTPYKWSACTCSARCPQLTHRAITLQAAKDHAQLI